MDHEQKRTRAGEDLSAWPNMVREHLPLIATGVIFLFVVVKVFRVAHLDTSTAFALLQASGPTAIAVGALLSILPSLMGLTTWFLAIAVFSGTGTPRQRRWMVEVISTTLLVWFYLLPWKSFVFELLVLVALGLFFKLARTRGWVWANFDWQAAIGTLLAVALITPTVWLAPEVLRVHGKEPFVGYVLSRDDQWTAILTDSDRAVLLIPSGDLDSRSVCSMTSHPGRSGFQIVLGESGSANPECPPSGGSSGG